MVSIFRNQPEIFPLCILYSSDLKKCANNDSKNGKGKQTNNSEWNLKQRKQATHLDTETQFTDTGICRAKEPMSKSLEIRHVML